MATCLVCGAAEHDWEHPAEIRNVSTPEDIARNEIRLLVNWQGDEAPLRWERPRIVSTRAAAAGTPQPKGWEA